MMDDFDTFIFLQNMDIIERDERNRKIANYLNDNDYDELSDEVIDEICEVFHIRHSDIDRDDISEIKKFAGIW